MSLQGESSGREAPSAGPPDLSAVGEWTDGALANGVLLCQVDAYTELRRRHLASVTAVTRMILGNRSSCEDVVAEVFVGFWLAPEKFDAQRGTVLAYLRLTARGRSIDVVRSETARRRRELTRDITVLPHDADAHLIGAESAGDLRRALSQLPDDERTPIELAFFRGMTYGDVARQLQLPEGTVKSRIRRGLRRLEVSDNLEVQRSERSATDRHDEGRQVAKRRSEPKGSDGDEGDELMSEAESAAASVDS